MLKVIYLWFIHKKRGQRAREYKALELNERMPVKTFRRFEIDGYGYIKKEEVRNNVQL